MCGDVDAGKVIERLRGLSYMTPKYPSRPRREYVWNSSEDVLVKVQNNGSPLSEFRFDWKLPRTPRKNMNTVQPLVVEMYMTELSLLAERRLKDAFMAADLPYASVACSYAQPANHLDDDAFTVEVKTAKEDADKAVRIAASVLSSIASGDITETQQGDVENLCHDIRLSNEKTFSNAQHVRRCASAFLYNESLASEKTKNDFPL